MNNNDITLELAPASEAPLVANLLELYQYDLSEIFQLDVGPGGRFGYERLPLYWSESLHRFPFLIKLDGRVVGFALATLGSPASDDPRVFDVAEFFILRRYRHRGVGKRAAHLLWDQHPGRWFVRVYERNAGALIFWRQVISEYGVGANEELREQPERWCVFSFLSRDNRRDSRIS